MRALRPSFSPTTIAAPAPPRRWARGVALAAVAALALAALPAGAGGRDDHDRVRAAVAAGEVLPLPQLLERVQRSHPGQVLELELDRDGGRWIYEIKLLQPGGQRVELDVDAGTGDVLATRNKRRRGAEAR